MLKRIAFEKTLNTRDLGGYATKNGGQTQFCRFWRSDAPVFLTQDELELMRDKRITTIIDLRGDNEVGRAPCFLSGLQGFCYHRFPISGEGLLPDEEKDVPEMYLAMLGAREAMLGAMRAFAKAEGGVLFHCTAGKDRTGVIAALLLLLAGVAKTDIIADYQVSQTYIAPMIERFIAHDPSVHYWVGQSKPDYLSGFLALFFSRYQTAEHYLLSIGLTKAEIDAIIKKLTE